MEIPGYKYDSEKNRYYKILKTGEFPDNKYTISAIAESQRRYEREGDSIRVKHIAQESNQHAGRESMFQASKLGSKARSVFPSRSSSPMSQFCWTNAGGIVCGHRNGQLSTRSHATSVGRSIVALKSSGRGVFAVSVDADFGSFVASSASSISIPRTFVTGLLISQNSKIYLGSDSGICIWNNSSSEIETVNVGSVSSMAEFQPAEPKTILLGRKDGCVNRFDERSGLASSLFSLENKKMVTNLVTIDANRVVSTGLEDHMRMHDLRNTRTPLINFAEYRNWSTYRHGLASDPSANCVAVGLDDGTVRVYDSTTGVSIKHIPANSHKSIVTQLDWGDAALYMAKSNKLVYMSNRRVDAVPSRNTAHNEEAHSTLVSDLESISDNLNRDIS